MGQALLGIGAGALGGFGEAYDTAAANRQKRQFGDIELQNAHREAATLAAAGNSLGALAGIGGGQSGMGGSPGMPPGGAPGGQGEPPPPMPQPGGTAVPRPGSSVWPQGGSQVIPSGIGQQQPPPGPMRSMGMPIPPIMAAQAPGPPMPPMTQQGSIQAMAPQGQGQQPMGPFPGPAPSVGLSPGAAPGGVSPASTPPGGLRGREQLDPSMQSRGGFPQPSSLDWRQIVQAVQKANPGAPPDVQIGAVSKLIGLMTPIAKAEWLQAHNQFLENQLRERRYEANIRYGRPQPTKQVGLQEEQSAPAGQPPAGQPQTRQASGQTGPDLSGGEQVIQAGWTVNQPPEISASPVATGKLPSNHPFSSKQGGYEMTPDDMNLALDIYNYRSPPLYESRGPKTNPRQIAIMNAVRRLGYDIGEEPYDAANWQLHQRGTIAFGTGTQGNTIRSLDVAQRHLKTLGELSRTLEDAKGGESNAKVLSNLNNILMTQFGAPEANNIDAAKQIIAAEVVKAVNASGGGVKERLEAAGHIDPALNAKQMQGVIDTYHKLIDGQLKGFEAQWRRDPANKDKDFRKVLKLDAEQPAAPAEDYKNTPEYKKAIESGHSDAEIRKFLKIGPGTAQPFADKSFMSAKSKKSVSDEWVPKGQDLFPSDAPKSTNIEDRRKDKRYENYPFIHIDRSKNRPIEDIKKDFSRARTDSDFEYLEEQLKEAYLKRKRSTKEIQKDIDEIDARIEKNKGKSYGEYSMDVIMYDILDEELEAAKKRSKPMRAFGGSSERTNEPEWEPYPGRTLLPGVKPSKNIEDRRKEPQYYRPIKDIEKAMENTDDPGELDTLEMEYQATLAAAEKRKKRKKK